MVIHISFGMCPTAHLMKQSATAKQPLKKLRLSSIPVFHSRQMRREFVNKFGRVSSAVKPARYFYHDLIGDSSGSEMSSQKELDDRIK